MNLFICVTVLLATATNALNSARAESEFSTAQTPKGSLSFLEPEPSVAQKNEIPEPEVNGKEGHVGEEQINGVTNDHSEDPLSFYDPESHLLILDEITSPQRKGQGDEWIGEHTDDVTSKLSEENNKVSDKTNDIRATEDNQAPERQLEGQMVNEKTQSLCTASQIEDVCVTPTEISELNEVPRQNNNDMPAANQNTSDISETRDVIKENDSMPLFFGEEEQTKDREQTTEQSITETNLPQVETTPTAPPCPLMWPECAKQDLDNVTADVARDLSAFALELFKAVKRTRPNVVVSPISIALALSQLMLGAGGKTKEELLKTLYRSVNNPECVHDAIRKLTNFDSLLTANEIFYSKDLSLYGEFINQSTTFYGSKGIPLHKDNERSLKKINSWVSKKTKTLIPQLLQELSSDLQLMLINVLYYQGKWISRFDPKQTRTEKFHSSRSSPVIVARFPLSDNCSLLIFMPVSNTADSLKTMEGKLNGEVMTQLMTLLEQMDPRATTVYFPQLKLDSDIRLNEVLSLVGLFDLFEYPDLCALSNSTELVVSDVHHRAILEVKEEGVKAAAATSITVARTVSVFAVRKPFLFILVSDRSKIPILIGRVTDPSQQ
ncbi:plasma protease C1 inhibitor isoform X2 [Pseudophryne corroboree]|uniref:plasma protease C1 inhibitor isoform X2 n=1 Tax=Pseudophryne corroboree TaxID=495146 RepID=UPI0030817EA5